MAHFPPYPPPGLWMGTLWHKMAAMRLYSWLTHNSVVDGASQWPVQDTIHRSTPQKEALCKLNSQQQLRSTYMDSVVDNWRVKMYMWGQLAVIRFLLKCLFVYILNELQFVSPQTHICTLWTTSTSLSLTHRRPMFLSVSPFLYDSEANMFSSRGIFKTLTCKHQRKSCSIHEE